MPWSNFSSSQKSSADKKVKVAGPSNRHYSSHTTQPYKWIWTKNKNNVLDAPAAASTFVHLHPPVSTCVQLRPPVSTSVCDGTQQNVKWYRYFFSGTKYFRYRYRYFFWYQILPIPIPRLSSGTKLFRYRFQNLQQKWKIPGNGTYTIINLLTFKILATKISSGTKFYRYRLRDFFGTKFFRYHLKK